MSFQANIAEILKEEYGIETRGKLMAALEKLDTIDLAVFCTDIPDKRKCKKEKAS